MGLFFGFGPRVLGLEGRSGLEDRAGLERRAGLGRVE
jgi:hypothetical protein